MRKFGFDWSRKVGIENQNIMVLTEARKYTGVKNILNRKSYQKYKSQSNQVNKKKKNLPFKIIAFL